MANSPTYLDLTGLQQFLAKLKEYFSGLKPDSAAKTDAILFGRVDSTSTATEFTATVDGLDSLYDGATVMLQNGVVTSASGFTINVNNLGEKPVYNNLATGNDITPTSPTRDTTIFNINYTMLFVYDSQLVSGGAWICYRGYDGNTNTIGYQVRTNSGRKPAADTGYRYRIWLTSPDGAKWVPINTSSQTNATTARTLNTRAIDPFGPIAYNSTNGTCNSGSNLPAATMWRVYTLTIGYSYVKTLTAWDSVYLKCQPQTDGSAVMKDIVQALPTSKDGFIYIHLGTAYSTTAMELQSEHPVYWHDGTGIRLWTGVEPSGGDMQNVWYAVHNSVISSMPISVSCPGFQAVDGAVLVVRFTYANTLTDQAYLKVNDDDPIAVTPLGASDKAWRYPWVDGTVISFVYTGGVFRPIAKHNATHCYYATTETSADESVKVLTGDEIVVNQGSMVAVRFVNGSTAAPIRFSVYGTVNNVRKNLDIISSSNPLTFAPGETGVFVFTNLGYQFVAKSDPVEIASASTLGGVKVGSGLSIDSSGVLSASGGSTVAVTPSLTSGTQVGSISVDGTSKTLYAPTPPTASTATPSMDGTAAVGSSTSYARADHVHPIDTSRQAALVSGINIKTINGNSILGSGDLAISGGSSGATYTTQAVSIPTSGWSNNAAVVSVAAVTSTSDVIVAPAPESISAWAAAGVYCSAQGDGRLTFTCSTTPTSALTANVMIFQSNTTSASGVSF